MYVDIKPVDLTPSDKTRKEIVELTKYAKWYMKQPNKALKDVPIVKEGY